MYYNTAYNLILYYYNIKLHDYVSVFRLAFVVTGKLAEV